MLVHRCFGLRRFEAELMIQYEQRRVICMPRVIVEVLSTWQVIVIFILIMIVLPTIFYFASFDKKPVKIKKKAMRSAPAIRTAPSRSQEDNEEMDEDE